jgi:hypothetical protein
MIALCMNAHNDFNNRVCSVFKKAQMVRQSG